MNTVVSSEYSEYAPYRIIIIIIILLSPQNMLPTEGRSETKTIFWVLCFNQILKTFLIKFNLEGMESAEWEQVQVYM